MKFILEQQKSLNGIFAIETMDSNTKEVLLPFDWLNNIMTKYGSYYVLLIWMY